MLKDKGEIRAGLAAAAVCVATMAALGTSPMGWTGCAPVRAALHNFVHANWAHLGANMVSLWLLRPGWRELGRALLLGSLAWLAASPFAASTPVGLSDALVAMLGARAASRPGWWGTRWFRTTAVVLVATSLLPGVSRLTHAASLAAGLLAGAAARNRTDYGLAQGRRQG